jgi:ankyrin repeat protein
MNPDLTEALLRMAACESNSTVLSRMVETFNCNAALVTDENGNTLLHLAARSCVAELFQFLLKSENSFEHPEQALHKQLNSINPLFTNSENKTVFHVACEAGTPGNSAPAVAEVFSRVFVENS